MFKIPLDLLAKLVGGLAFILLGFFLGNFKKKKSDNRRGDYDNRAHVAEDWIERIEKLSDIAGKSVMEKQEARMELIKLLRYAEEHISVCESPVDDFNAFVSVLKKKYANDKG
jgi:tetrahydromethanopterin S-methyltransferase subunit H